MYDNPLYDETVALLRAAVDAPAGEDIRPKVNAALVLLVTMIGKEAAPRLPDLRNEIRESFEGHKPLYLNGVEIFVESIDIKHDLDELAELPGIRRHAITRGSSITITFPVFL